MSGFARRKKIRHLGSTEGGHCINYKDVESLKNYLSEAYKLVPGRITGTTAHFQRQLAREVQKARFIGFLPYCDSHQ